MAAWFGQGVYMPRGPRLDVEGALQHVMARGIERRELFRSDRDREDFLSRVAVLVPDTGAAIYAWSLMPNHFHLLVRSGPAGLSTFMRRLQTGYASAFNRRHRRSGHLFQNRFKSILVEDGPYLLELVRYIHLNPMRAGLVRNLRELDGYRWSGHAVLLGKRKAAWQDTEQVLLQFGETRGRAVRAYRDFVSEGVSLGWRSELAASGRIGRTSGDEAVETLEPDRDGRHVGEGILGSGKFVEEICKQVEGRAQRRLGPEEVQFALEGALGKVCRKHGVGAEQVRGPGRERAVSWARAELAYEAVRRQGIAAKAVARFLSVSPAAISQMVVRAGKLG